MDTVSTRPAVADGYVVDTLDLLMFRISDRLPIRYRGTVLTLSKPDFVTFEAQLNSAKNLVGPLNRSKIDPQKWRHYNFPKGRL